MNLKHKVFFWLAVVCLPFSLTAQTFSNFNKKGEQVTKFSKLGDAVDAHDGEIAYFNGTYYLYGTSYGCGFEWGHKDAPFCGFEVYSSKDMVTWTDKGTLFDASTPVWQTRCNGNTYGCFRPHVIYNSKTKLYVLWINVYDNRVGYRVFTSKTPVGPFVEQAEPKLAVNADAAVGGLNNGDHDTFVDDDGKAYLAYTDWHAKGAIAIEQLSDDYLTGTGKVVQAVTKESTEAPALFKRKGIYYLIYSDPNCGYCGGTGASYRTAKSPLGPWSEGIKISDNSCGGQPSFVSSIKLKTGDVFLFGSDLWNNAAKNESLANYYWAPLKFNEDGSIKPIACQNTVAVPGSTKTDESLNYAPGCDINAATKRTTSFKAAKTGLLTNLSLSTFKSAYPDAELQITISAEGSDQPLKSFTVNAGRLSWSPKNLVLHPEIKVIAGKTYTISISSTISKGCYGLEYDRATKDSAEPAFLYKLTIASK
ncbi:family 43 glycosylhydrolase [Mucilaginibacter corticis]|uniref:Family 43 glycosylhydrolase n=1 Tax=Mucilaginibacter corticis TaxID=2597670 RepID=A0A556MH06_9SPHI|nr:family 43 glycosylhydrolase [Mucilaginibacter corticis]TSJ39159.1 family 43 glycosylhydrolase [Mucilaginibacter corticis]